MAVVHPRRGHEDCTTAIAECNHIDFGEPKGIPKKRRPDCPFGSSESLRGIIKHFQAEDDIE